MFDLLGMGAGAKQGHAVPVLVTRYSTNAPAPSLPALSCVIHGVPPSLLPWTLMSKDLPTKSWVKEI